MYLRTEKGEYVNAAQVDLFRPVDKPENRKGWEAWMRTAEGKWLKFPLDEHYDEPGRLEAMIGVIARREEPGRHHGNRDPRGGNGGRR